MTKNELIQIKMHITNNIGFLTVEEIMEYYHTFLNGSNKYLLGAEFNKKVYGFYTEEIPLKYCSCQTDHKKKIQYLRFRPHQHGAKEIAAREDAICFGTTERVYTLYTCNTKKGYNSGYCFEKVVYERYGMADEWRQDNKASTEGGDIYLNGEEIQMKYWEKDSLATITNTDKILRQIDRILELMED